LIGVLVFFQSSSNTWNWWVPIEGRKTLYHL